MPWKRNRGKRGLPGRHLGLLPYTPKVRGFLENLGIEVPPLEQVSAGRLIAYINHGWDRRRQPRRRIRKALPALRHRRADMSSEALALDPGHEVRIGWVSALQRPARGSA